MHLNIPSLQDIPPPKPISKLLAMSLPTRYQMLRKLFLRLPDRLAHRDWRSEGLATKARCARVTASTRRLGMSCFFHRNSLLMMGITAYWFTHWSDAVASTAKPLYRVRHLNIEFQLPPDWTARSCPTSFGDNCIALWPRGRRNQSDIPIRIEARKASFEATARDHGLFQKRGSAWVKHGRFNTSQAVAISGANWSWIEAIASCGIFDELGFHAAGGQCYTAIIGRGKRSAIIETDGLTATNKTAAMIVKSFRFTRS